VFCLLRHKKEKKRERQKKSYKCMHTLLIREALFGTRSSTHHRQRIINFAFFANTNNKTRTTTTTVSRRAMSGLWSHVEAAPKVLLHCFSFFFGFFFPGLKPPFYLFVSLFLSLSLSRAVL
jgi:hypothetical protein